MKKKIMICSIIVVFLIMSYFIWYLIPINLTYIGVDDILYLKVGSGSTGNVRIIADYDSVTKILNNLQELTLSRDGFSKNSNGFGYSLTLYNSDGEEVESFHINSSNRISDGTYFYDVSNSLIDFDYIVSLAEGLDVVDIIDISIKDNIPTDDALELIYTDGEYDYYLPSIKAHYINVYFNDGSVLLLKDALESRVMNISDLELFDISYSKEKIENDWDISYVLIEYNGVEVNITVNVDSDDFVILDAFYIEKLVDDNYEWVIPKTDTLNFYKGRTVDGDLNVVVDIDKYYNELDKGSYRLSQEIMCTSCDNEKRIYYAYFEIE